MRLAGSLILLTRRASKSIPSRYRDASPLVVRARPAQPTLGWLRMGSFVAPVALGRSGIRANKREGDGATPRGAFRLLRLWFRPDRGPRPRTKLPIWRIGPGDAWCEDPADRRYNRPFRLGEGEHGDRLQREDRLYDLLIEINHNTRPRIAGRGSAVFVHVARPGFAPTAGCVALRPSDLRRLIAKLSRKSRILIQ
jgi:L,D-peptidoglycan transpeptidase YkuD (ErfK/YbiS/YcfS/YnhG family)